MRSDHECRGVEKEELRETLLLVNLREQEEASFLRHEDHRQGFLGADGVGHHHQPIQQSRSHRDGRRQDRIQASEVHPCHGSHVDPAERCGEKTRKCHEGH